MQPYEQLEYEIGKWAGVEHVVACSSGTAALHLALEALCLESGSEVIVPDFTMVACPRAVTMAGLTPVFVDCGEDLLIDCDLVSRISDIEEIRAIMPVHIYGRRCDMDAIISTANDVDWWVVEDMAEAHGIKPHPSSDAWAWSFYRNKIVAGEEGGAVAFRCKEHADLARQLRSLGFTDAHDFMHVPRGCNYRLANSLAKPILQSLRQFESTMMLRQKIRDMYDRLCPLEWMMPERDVPWVYDLRIRGLKNVDEGVKALNDDGIAARHGFKPMSEQAEYGGRSGMKWFGGPDGVSVAKRMSREVFYLPIDPQHINERKIKQSFETIKRVARTT